MSSHIQRPLQTRMHLDYELYSQVCNKTLNVNLWKRLFLSLMGGCQKQLPYIHYKSSPSPAGSLSLFQTLQMLVRKENSCSWNEGIDFPWVEAAFFWTVHSGCKCCRHKAPLTCLMSRLNNCGIFTADLKGPFDWEPRVWSCSFNRNTISRACTNNFLWSARQRARNESRLPFQLSTPGRSNAFLMPCGSTTFQNHN